MRDAVRYRQRRIGGKSGDSGDEMPIDDSQDDWEMKDALSFLIPTSFRFPRNTIVLGGSTSASTSTSTNFTEARTPSKAITDDDLSKKASDLDDDASNASVYSYVLILYSIFEIVENEF